MTQGKKRFRTDRSYSELRSINIKTEFIKHHPGSVMIEVGDTRVVCTAILQDRVPFFLKGTGHGWLNAEYNMIPGSSEVRIERPGPTRAPKGRSMEIQRLIGRSLRSVIDLSVIGERTIMIDCDVVQADGGTRTTSITGSFIALAKGIDAWIKQGIISTTPLKDYVAATSAGIVDGEFLLDLCYEEDSAASVDMNIVMTGSGRLSEVQVTGEEATFSRDDHDKLLDLCIKGLNKIIDTEKEVLKGIFKPTIIV